MTIQKNQALYRILFVFSTFLLLISAMYWFSIFLTPDAPRHTGHVLLEGWVGPYETEETFHLLNSMEEPQLYIVGKKYDDRFPVPAEELYFWRLEEGLLLLTNATMFVEPAILSKVMDRDRVSLAFEVTGSDVSGIFAHFTVLVNGEKAGTFFTSGSKMVYRLANPVDAPVHSLGIYYDNDLATREEGRYLILHSISIGDAQIIPGPDNTWVTFVRSEPATGFTSEAAQKASYLIDLGIDPDQIQIVEYDPGTMNQTRLGAIAFMKWSGDKSIPALNVVSSGFHSRRTWVTYKRILSPETKVGVISFPDIMGRKQTFDSKRRHLIQLIDESASYIGNWFYFNFAGSKESEDQRD